MAAPLVPPKVVPKAFEVKLPISFLKGETEFTQTKVPLMQNSEPTPHQQIEIQITENGSPLQLLKLKSTICS